MQKRMFLQISTLIWRLRGRTNNALFFGWYRLNKYHLWTSENKGFFFPNRQTSYWERIIKYTCGNTNFSSSFGYTKCRIIIFTTSEWVVHYLWRTRRKKKEEEIKIKKKYTESNGTLKLSDLCDRWITLTGLWIK